jgi:hypothetical protein
MCTLTEEWMIGCCCQKAPHSHGSHSGARLRSKVWTEWRPSIWTMVAMAGAETIRLCLDWGLVRGGRGGEGGRGGMVVGPHGCEPEKFHGLCGMTSCCTGIECPAAHGRQKPD